MTSELLINTTLDRIGSDLQRAEERLNRRKTRRRAVVAAPFAAATLAATAAVAGLSPWPAGSTMHGDNGTPILSLQGDTSHPYDPKSASDVARIDQARAALAGAPAAPAFAPRAYTPPANDSETAYGTCTQVQDSLVACGTDATSHFYLVKNPANAWVPAGNCVSTATTEACTYPYKLAIDTTAPSNPTLARVS